MIASVDKSTVSGSNTTETKMLGVILPEKLSSGLKTLLLMQFLPERVYNASNCGDNCVCWILSIAKKHGITINLYHLMDLAAGVLLQQLPIRVKSSTLWTSWCL